MNTCICTLEPFPGFNGQRCSMRLYADPSYPTKAKEKFKCIMNYFLLSKKRVDADRSWTGSKVAFIRKTFENMPALFSNFCGRYGIVSGSIV